MSTAPARPASAPYRPEPPCWDEAVDARGRVRPHYGPTMARLAASDLASLEEQVRRAVAAEGVVHGVGAGVHPYRVDVVPRIVGAAEWRRLEAGLVQRVRALDRFVADVHGPRRAIADGVVPAEAVLGSKYLEPDLAGLPAPALWIGVAGPDVVRDTDGDLVVLEDNVRTPTMMAFAVAARRAVAPLHRDGPAPRPIENAVADLARATLAAAAPAVHEPRAVILSDEGRSVVRWELHALGRLLGVPVVTLDQLAHARGRLVRRDGGEPVDVVWRRTSEERLHRDGGGPTELAAALLPPMRAGRLAVVNAFGTGVADDKRIYPYVEDLVRYHLGEEPLLRSVPTVDLMHPGRRAEALERLDELVVKPRAGSGGYGVVIGPHADRATLARVRRALTAAPGDWLAQRVVRLSTHPTAADGVLEPRHLDLRPFVFSDGRVLRVLPGGLSRMAPRRGDLIVNSSQGGGGKDTWVLPERP